MMGKAVLISIRPKWCELIAIGKKTVEVRKTAPKLPTPYKSYIYETIDSKYENIGIHDPDAPIYKSFVHHPGKVIGEYICDEVYKFSTRVYLGEEQKISDEEIVTKSRVSRQELRSYEGRRQGIFGLHISNLVIYDKPKELSAFHYCDTCEYGLFCNDDKTCKKKMLRPPQSWCYVEELA